MRLMAPIRLLCVAAALGIILAERADAGGFFWHHGYGSKTVVTTQGSSMMLAPATVGTLSLVPATTLTGTTLQFTPQTTLQLVGGASMGTTLQLSPTVVTGQALQLTPQTTLQLVGGASTGSTLTFTVQNRGAQTLNVGSSNADVDTAYQVLTLGFGNNTAKVVRLEQALNDKLDTLSSGVGDILSNADLGAILSNTAKAFLNDNGFGIVFNDVEPIVAKLIAKVIANRQARKSGTQPANTNTSPNANAQPSGNTPAGGQTFNISGRIVLSPTTGGSTTPSGGPTGNTPPATGITTDPGVTAAPSIP
jgi:hypothetical protein